ncbi:MAG: hypothetical protein LBT74_04605 [Acidobacteriota bacterium]|jgi:hypothetical protein|nr:hypothetical protein [Acidobacteriota bacterium]
MRPIDRFFQSDEEGKGSTGCLLTIVLLVAIAFVSFKAGPAYYRNYALDGDLQVEVSRIGARPQPQDVVVKNLIKLGEKNNIRLTKENIKVERFAGQLVVTIDYTVPVDFIVTQRDIHFVVKGTTYAIT